MRAICAACALALLAAAAPAARSGHVVDLEVRAGGCARTDAPIDVAIDFAVLSKARGVTKPLRADSVDVVEVDAAGRVRDEAVPFQVDPPRAADASRRSIATMVVLLKGPTAANAVRRFCLIFRQAGTSFLPRRVAPLLKLADDVEHEGQKSYRIVTPKATWYYHKQGAGFASLEDANGNDWIGFHPGGGAGGQYRGIPNLAHPEGCFHPGGKKCTSRVVAAGPLKATIHSESNDRKWTCRWEVYPSFARLTVLKVAHPYWLLYEGTPGGKLDPDGDFCVRGDGTRTPASKRWTGDIPAGSAKGGPEWLYFGDAKCRRVLFLAQHEDDRQVDSYWPMQGKMTVFGFGRKGLGKFLKRVPARFTVGLCEQTEHGQVAAAVLGATQPFQIKLSPVKPAGK